MKKLLAVCLIFAALSMPAKMPDCEGKRVIALGDSNTWLGGDSCSDSLGWTFWFKQLAHPAWMVSYSRSGATWSHVPETRLDMEEVTTAWGDNNVIFNQVKRLERDINNGLETPDVIIIAAGVNDAWIKRPGAWNNDTSFMSVRGAVMQNCRLLTQIAPKAQIVLLSPALNRKTTDDEMHRIGQIIEQAFPQSLTVRMDLLDKPPVTSDGVHTTTQGALTVARAILAQ